MVRTLFREGTKRFWGLSLFITIPYFGRFYRDSGPKADKIVALEILVRRPIKLLHSRHFWAPQKCRECNSFCQEEREALLLLSFLFARPLSGAFAKSWFSSTSWG